MDYKRLTIPLPEPEFAALQKLAKRELRRPEDQARHILRTILLIESHENSKTATSEVFQAQQVSGFAGINP